MSEKEFRLDPDSELRFEVEGKQDTVDLTVSLSIEGQLMLLHLLSLFYLIVSTVNNDFH